jgi:3-methylfumaryl-CoA hydratase
MTSATFKSEEWIGRTWTRQEKISEHLVEKFRGTLSPYLAKAFEVPLGLHWCLVPDVVQQDALGVDGHPRLGQLLPDVGLPRRMWAGGEMVFGRALRLGDVVNKTSTIENVSFKSGKSGNLCFVTLRHLYNVDGEAALNERQDVVYRAPNTLRSEKSAELQATAEQDWSVQATPILLFRYSALTFNGHRIHYDYPYATKEEGYEGLVVHGPMQATLMLNLAAEKMRRLPKRFSYRGQRPLTAGQVFGVSAALKNGAIEATVRDRNGAVTMMAEAD